MGYSVIRTIILQRSGLWTKSYLYKAAQSIGLRSFFFFLGLFAQKKKIKKRLNLKGIFQNFHLMELYGLTCGLSRELGMGREGEGKE